MTKVANKLNWKYRMPFPYPDLPLPTHPSLALEVRPLNPARGLGSAVSSPVGSEAEPQPKSNLMHFSFEIWHLVATILMIFLRINLLSFNLGGKNVTILHTFAALFQCHLCTAEKRDIFISSLCSVSLVATTLQCFLYCNVSTGRDRRWLGAKQHISWYKHSSSQQCCRTFCTRGSFVFLLVLCFTKFSFYCFVNYLLDVPLPPVSINCGRNSLSSEWFRARVWLGHLVSPVREPITGSGAEL